MLKFECFFFLHMMYVTASPVPYFFLLRIHYLLYTHVIDFSHAKWSILSQQLLFPVQSMLQELSIFFCWFSEPYFVTKLVFVEGLFIVVMLLL